MNFGEKVKEALIAKAAEALAVAVSVILIWVCSALGPVLLPILGNSISQVILVKVSLASLGLNLVFLLLFWITQKKPFLRLKYGIYWDSAKNPHCPNCKIPIGAYGAYSSGQGYYCKPCGKIFPLTDALGNHIKPEQALKEL
jgi:hypothetical protein